MATTALKSNLALLGTLVGEISESEFAELETAAGQKLMVQKVMEGQPGRQAISATAEQIFSNRPGFEVARKSKRIVCLAIQDEFEYMDPSSVRLLEAKVGPIFALGA